MPNVLAPPYSDTAKGSRGTFVRDLEARLEGFAHVYPATPPGALATPCVVVDDGASVAEYVAVGAWDRTFRLRLVGSLHDNAARASELDILLQVVESSAVWDEWGDVSPEFLWDVGDGSYPCLEVELIVYGQPEDAPEGTSDSMFSGQAVGSLVFDSDGAAESAFSIAATGSRTRSVPFLGAADEPTVSSGDASGSSVLEAQGDAVGAFDADATGSSVLGGTGDTTGAFTGDATAEVETPPVGGFDPLDIGWEVAFWTEGPAFIAEGHAPDGAVATWADEMGGDGLHQTNGARQPTYRTTHAILDAPVIDVAAAQGMEIVTTLSNTRAYTAVAVLAKTVAGSNDVMIDLAGSAGSGAFQASNGNWKVRRGVVFDIGHVQVVDELVFMASGDDGTNPTRWARFGDDHQTGTNFGTASANRLEFKDYDAGTTKAIWFIARYAGDLSVDPLWPDFLQWITDHYGIPT